MDAPRAADAQAKFADSIREFYGSRIIDLGVVPDVRFRHFRFRLQNGAFYKVKEKIRGWEGLRRCIVEAAPMDIYYSTACWLNPHAIASRLDPDILKNVMISCDLSFDIDAGKTLKTLDDARLQALLLHDFLSVRGISVRYTAFSGSKGFHVVCDDPWAAGIAECDPRRRELEAIKLRKGLVAEAKERGMVFDDKVTVDTRRIIRLPGTLNSKARLLCTVVTRSQLEGDAEAILKSASAESSSAPRIPQAREMTAPSALKTPGLLGRLGVRPKPEVFYSTFITNNIPGTRLKVPVLEVGVWVKRETAIRLIERVQRDYGLGDVLLFADGGKTVAVSLKALPRRRVEKALAAAESLNLSQSKKYGCTYMRVGKSIGVSGEVVEEEPAFLRVLEADLRGQASRTHFEFFSSLGIRLRGSGLVLCGAGKERLEMVHAVME